MAAADSREGSGYWEVNEMFGGNPLCLGAGCGACGRREPTKVGEEHGILLWLFHAAPSRTLATLLISQSVALFPHLQKEISSNSLSCSYFHGWSGGLDEVRGKWKRQFIHEPLICCY